MGHQAAVTPPNSSPPYGSLEAMSVQNITTVLLKSTGCSVLVMVTLQLGDDHPNQERFSRDVPVPRVTLSLNKNVHASMTWQGLSRHGEEGQ